MAGVIIKDSNAADLFRTVDLGRDEPEEELVVAA